MKISSYIQTLASLFSLCFICIGAEANEPLDESPWQLSIAVGAGVRTNPVMDNADIPLILIPQISYQGERFFIQNLDFGYSLYQTDEQYLHLLLTPSIDQIFFKEKDLNNIFVNSQNSFLTKNDSPSINADNAEYRTIDKQQLRPRRMAALLGFEYSYAINDIDLQLQALQEITQYYDGQEVRLALSKSIIVGKHDVKLTLGANWQSAKTLNYFYGVNENEALSNGYYAPVSSISTLMRLDWNYELNESWSLRFLTNYKHLGSSITESPLITTNNVVTAFVGGVYHF